MAANKGLGREVYQEAFERLGNISAVAREFGVCHRTVARSLRGKQTDPAIQAGMDAVGTGMVVNAALNFPRRGDYLRRLHMVPAMAWIKTKGTKDQPGYSLMLKPAANDADPLERIREAFTDLPAAPPAPPPLYADDDLLTLYPIADAHVGMLAWGEETGEDYDTKIACDRLRSWVGQCVASAPASGTA